MPPMAILTTLEAFNILKHTCFSSLNGLCFLSFTGAVLFLTRKQFLSFNQIAFKVAKLAFSKQKFIQIG